MPVLSSHSVALHAAGRDAASCGRTSKDSPLQHFPPQPRDHGSITFQQQHFSQHLPPSGRAASELLINTTSNLRVIVKANLRAKTFQGCTVFRKSSRKKRRLFKKRKWGKISKDVFPSSKTGGGGSWSAYGRNQRRSKLQVEKRSFRFQREM